MRRLPGLAIIEILIVLVTIAILATVTSIISVKVIRNAELDRISETIRGELVAAQMDTVAGTFDSAWGVAFSSSTITRFSGVSYESRNVSLDRITLLNAEAVTLSGTTSVSFLRPTGLPSASSTIVITNGDATSTATLTTTGAITFSSSRAPTAILTAPATPVPPPAPPPAPPPPPDVTAPVISNVGLSGVSQTEATLTWTTNENASAFVDYDTVVGPPFTFTGGAALPLQRSHSVTLTGLSPGTMYYLQFRSLDAADNVGTLGGLQLTTSS